MEKSNYSPDMMIKNNGLSINETKVLQNKFISEYATRKGWTVESLTTEQLAEIKEQSGFKSAGLMLG
jgi:hypothetical protein